MKKSKLSYGSFMVAALFAFFTSEANAQAGIYENLMIGIDSKTGVVSGAYSEQRGITPGPDFSCVFAIRGVTTNTALVVGFPGEGEVSKGQLTMSSKNGKPQIHLKLAEQQPGCAQASPIDFVGGELFEQSEPKPWQAVWVVKSKRAHFYNSPDEKSKRKAYLVYADRVGVLKLSSSWAKVEYVSGGKSTTGWMPVRDIGGL